MDEYVTLEEFYNFFYLKYKLSKRTLQRWALLGYVIKPEYRWKNGFCNVTHVNSVLYHINKKDRNHTIECLFKRKESTN